MMQKKINGYDDGTMNLMPENDWSHDMETLNILTNYEHLNIFDFFFFNETNNDLLLYCINVVMLYFSPCIVLLLSLPF